MVPLAASIAVVLAAVWAGGALRLAMAEMLGRVGASGARAQLQLERNIERSGAWRNQMQWRYRAVGGSLEFGLGAVTNFFDTLGIGSFAPTTA